MKGHLILLSVNKIEKAPGVWVYEDAFETGNFCEEIEKESSKDWPYISWYSSQTGDGVNTSTSEYRSSLEMHLGILYGDTVNEQLQNLKDTLLEDILKPIDKCVWDYRNYFDLALQKDSGFVLLKYLDSGEYHIHHDHGPDNSRVISLVACLGEDFEGGELEFPHYNVKLKLKKNSLVIFPSNFPYSHIAHPVTGGIKYSLVTWFI